MRWTKDEEAFLIHNYRIILPEILCKIFNRKWEAIRKKAHTLNTFKASKKGLPAKERFDKSYRVNTESNCWEWTGFVWPTGYGCFYDGFNTTLAHRFSHEFYKGAIAEDLVIDHLCRNRKCVNPTHLEAVTHQENIDRGLGAKQENCHKGHPLQGKNLYTQPDGKRVCRICKNKRKRKYRENTSIL